MRDATVVAPEVDSVHVMFAVAPVSVSPPFGDVTVATGCPRPISQRSVLSSTSFRIVEGSLFVSMPLHSKYMVARRDVCPPHTADAGDPSGPELSQRNAQLSVPEGSPLIQS